MKKVNSTQQLLELIGGVCPKISKDDLGFPVEENLSSCFEIVRQTEQYTIYRIVINSWHLDFSKTAASTKPAYKLSPITGYLFIPVIEAPPSSAIIARHQSKWQYQFGAGETMGLEGDNEDSLKNLLPFALKHGCVMICTDSLGYGQHPLTKNRNAIDLAQVESCYDRLLRCYGKTYLWQVINDIRANVALLDVLANKGIVRAGCYHGLGHSMGAQQLLVAAPFIPKLKHLMVNAGITTMQYLAENFRKVLHGPSLMIPNIVQCGDNMLLLEALNEHGVDVQLALGENDLGNPHDVIKRMLNTLKRHDQSMTVKLKKYRGGHQLTEEVLDWFGEGLDNFALAFGKHRVS